MAHKKAGGSTALGRDSHGQRLGIKVSAGSHAKSGSIIVRQRGTRVFPGLNVRKGTDDTLYATQAGIVRFQDRKKPNFHGIPRKVKLVHVDPVKK